MSWFNKNGKASTGYDADVLMTALNKAQSAFMIIDRDLVITFANKTTIDLLSQNEEVLVDLYPGLDLSKIMGTCIDIFHKNPSHQRKILNDIRNYPYDTTIHVGPLRFLIHVEAMLDKHGDHIGSTLEWSDVTAKLKNEETIELLQSALMDSNSATMMIDADRVITYANEESKAILKKHGSALQSLYPSFNPNKVVGTCIDIFHKNPSHQAKILSDPSKFPYETDIHVGPLTFEICVNGVFDSSGRVVGNRLEWLDVTESRATEFLVGQLQSTVHGMTTMIMMADADLNVTYLNPSLESMFHKNEAEIRKVLSNFDVNNLVGTNIDIFHKNPAHQRSILGNPSNLPVSAEIKVGTLEFRVTAIALRDSNGEHVGSTAQWEDITEAKDAERQIENLINFAVVGELDKRVNTDKYDGFMKDIGDGVNTLLDTVVTPLQKSTRVMQELAKGVLTEEMDGEYQGIFDVLKCAINESIQNLRKIVTEINQSTSNVASSSSEIAQGNQDLSRRTEKQAASLEETASSLEELTSTIKQNTENARRANGLAREAREEANKGGDVVKVAVKAMDAIDESSTKISDIIGVIDEIAFQTNLLALNAAVEAARAGDQGRGFAVVASEVRNLAQRSAEAAKEIKSLISDSVSKVNEGSKLVNESGETLEAIVGSVTNVSDVINDIAAASEEQLSGIEEINIAVSNMDEMTQQNAALVEEAAASSETLDGQATSLSDMMSYFTLDQSVVTLGVTAKPSAKAANSVSKKPSVKRSQAASGTGSDSEWEEF